jgi:hypothetical protein
VLITPPVPLLAIPFANPVVVCPSLVVLDNGLTTVVPLATPVLAPPAASFPPTVRVPRPVILLLALLVLARLDNMFPLVASVLKLPTPLVVMTVVL